MHSAAGDPTTSATVLHLNRICWQEVEEVVVIKIIIQRYLYVNKDDHQKKEKFMNINLPDHSLRAAFCHAISS